MSTGHVFRPTTTVTILRTTPSDLSDEFGEAIDNETVAATGVPASILSDKKRASKETKGDTGLYVNDRLTKVEFYVGRFRGDVDVRLYTDRLKDERTGYIYIVEDVDTQDNPYGSAATKVFLQRTF